MCHTSRFCEWRLALTISHSQVKRTAAGHSAFGDPGEWIGTDTWKMKQVISEWTHVVVKIAFWIRQRCQKWHKTQLIHWQANSFFFCCFFFLSGEVLRCTQSDTNTAEQLYLTLLVRRQNSLKTSWHPCVCVTGGLESRRGARLGGKDQTPVSACFGKPSRRRVRANPAPHRPHKRPP